MARLKPVPAPPNGKLYLCLATQPLFSSGRPSATPELQRIGSEKPALYNYTCLKGFANVNRDTPLFRESGTNIMAHKFTHSLTLLKAGGSPAAMDPSVIDA